MTRLNLSLWLIGLLLQGLLLAALWARRLLVRLRYFAVLVGFYCCRSVMLVVLSGGGRKFVSPLLLTCLALVDIALQMAVAWRIFTAVSMANVRFALKGSSTHTEKLRLTGIFSMLVLLAAGCSVALPLCVPGTRLYQMDRSVLVTSFLFLLIAATTNWRLPSRICLRLAQGFAFYAAACMVGQVSCTLAATARDAHTFTHRSYIEPIAYLLTVMFWLYAIYREPEREAEETRDIGHTSGRLARMRG